MTDIELIEKKLAFIETCVQELRTYSNPALIATDLREERFAAHTLQIAIQAALDIASHVASDDRLGEPETNRLLFDLLARAGWLSPALTDTMHRMAGFRNIVVHGYQSVDRAILADIVVHRLGYPHAPIYPHAVQNSHPSLWISVELPHSGQREPAIGAAWLARGLVSAGACRMPIALSGKPFSSSTPSIA